MIRHVIVDTGPLVALLNPRDQWHEWVKLQFSEIVPPLLTCEAVITEACFLLRHNDKGMIATLGLLERGVVEIGLSLKDHSQQVATLMHRYASVPMSLADACIVRLTETLPKSVVFTLDGDFRIYRRHKTQKLSLLTPPIE